MGFVKDKITIFGYATAIKKKTYEALFDSGACRNYISKELSDGITVDNIGYPILMAPRDVRLANGHIESCEVIKFREIRIKNHSIEMPEFLVMDNLTEDVIIGARLMQEMKILLNPPNHSIIIRHSVPTGGG